MAFEEFGGTDPCIEAGLIFPVADDEVGVAIFEAFEDVHADESVEPVDCSGSGAEETFEAFAIVRFAIDVIDGDESGGGLLLS